jgi:hypothetical protein
MEKLTGNGLIDSHFSEEYLPRLLGDDVNNPNWKDLTNVKFEKIGRVLICHLLIEAHINRFIEAKSPKDFNFDTARLNFMQKLNIVKNSNAISGEDFYPSVLAVNRIRNSFSHTLGGEISLDDIRIIETFLKKYDENHRDKEYALKATLETHMPIAILEVFTSLFCAYFAGYCAALIRYNPHI